MAQPITIVGTITDSSGISKQVTITGIGQLQVDPGYGVPLPPPTATPPIYIPPVFPAHPIVPPPVDPGYGVPLPPLGIWGGAPPPHPAHPIAPGGRPPVDPGYGVPIPPGVATPPIYYPPEVWPPPVHPAHPIAPGGPPPT